MPIPKFTDEQLDKEVLYILKQHVGQANAIDRWEMVAKIYGTEAALRQDDNNAWDREIRFSVGRLRMKQSDLGLVICDLGNGAGRYLAANETEAWEFYRSYISPLKTRADTAKAIKKAVLHIWPNSLQMSLFDEISIDELEMA